MSSWGSKVPPAISFKKNPFKQKGVSLLRCIPVITSIDNELNIESHCHRTMYKPRWLTLPVITSLYDKNILESHIDSAMALDVYSASLLQTLLCCCLNFVMSSWVSKLPRAISFKKNPFKQNGVSLFRASTIIGSDISIKSLKRKT